ncbi:hypothetical protein OROHE_017363 [Orobanche hederae]
MGIFLLKNVIRKSVYAFRNSSFNLSLYIPRRHIHHDNTSYLPNKLPLLRRSHGGNNDGGDQVHYFSLLSTKNFSPEKQFHLPFSKIKVVGSCNGVVCVEDAEAEGRTALWNPSTNKFKSLPKTCIQRHPSASYVDFNSSGFGFDCNSQDYKVVRFVDNVFETKEGDYHHNEHHAELYSLESDSWKEIPYPLGMLTSGSGAYVNGVFYCVAVSKMGNEILSFDFGNHKFCSFGIPESGKRIGPYTTHLLEWDGSLAAIVYPYYGKGEKSFDLWVRNNESWIRVSIYRVSGAVRPLGFWTKDVLLFEGTCYDLRLFDLATQESEHLHIFDHPDVLEFIPCIESNVVLNGKSAREHRV